MYWYNLCSFLKWMEKFLVQEKLNKAFNWFNMSMVKSFIILVGMLLDPIALPGLKEYTVVYISIFSVGETHTFNWGRYSKHSFLKFKFFFVNVFSLIICNNSLYILNEQIKTSAFHLS